LYVGFVLEINLKFVWCVWWLYCILLLLLNCWFNIILWLCVFVFVFIFVCVVCMGVVCVLVLYMYVYIYIVFVWGLILIWVGSWSWEGEFYVWVVCCNLKIILCVFVLCDWGLVLCDLFWNYFVYFYVCYLVMGFCVVCCVCCVWMFLCCVLLCFEVWSVYFYFYWWVIFLGFKIWYFYCLINFGDYRLILKIKGLLRLGGLVGIGFCLFLCCESFGLVG